MTSQTISLQQGITRQFRKGVAGQFNSIPVIDLAGLASRDPSLAEKARLVADIKDACEKVGFFIVKNHGVDWKIIDDAFDGLKEFFTLPHEEKMKLSQDKSPSYMGYEPMFYTNVDGLTKGDKKEGVSVAYDPDIDAQSVGRDAIPILLQRENFWPEEGTSPKFRAGVEAYQLACLALMRKLVKLMALALGVEEDYFDKKTTYPIASVRCLHYPPQDPDEVSETGLGAHTDIQLMTCIAQTPYEQIALEVLNASGQWVQVKIEEPECLVVNLSDMMARLTNDVFQSTIHRVRNNSTQAQSRYSLPFFFGLNQDELTTTLPRFVTAENPLKEKYQKGVTGFEHYNNRLKKAHHKHPSSKGASTAALPFGMTRVDGVILEGL